MVVQEGADPLLWSGKVIRSSDRGQTWGAAAPLPKGMVGPAKNKPIILSDGTILSPSSEEVRGCLPFLAFRPEGCSDRV